MKLGLIVGGGALIIVAGAAGFFYFRSISFHSRPYATTPQPTHASVFSSIQDALTKNLSLKCDYVDTKQIHTVAYIKNGVIRSTVTDKNNPSQSGNMIMKDKKMYYWNDAGTIAMVMAMPEVTGAAPSVTPTDNNGQQVMSNLEQYKQSCVVATVDDSLFELPKGVTFQDQTQMMKMMPTGTPSGMNSQQMQQYMQQYKTSQ